MGAGVRVGLAKSFESSFARKHVGVGKHPTGDPVILQRAFGSYSNAVKTEQTIRVLLADDHSIVRAGLRALLETTPDIEVIGEAENGQQAVLETRRLQPDVVLLDLAMPLLNGLEAARQIARDVPAARVLILSGYSDEEHVCQAVEAGVAGYLMKEAGGGDLLETVRRTRNGEACFSPPLQSPLYKASRKGPGENPGDPIRDAGVHGRHAEVLQLIAEGYSTKQIASVLSISVKTVGRHRETLMAKLNIHKVATLTRYAVSSGVVESNLRPNWPARQERRQARIKKALML